ncbi:MAG: hypothetical protein Q9221_006018 [Calogaya cf. arnoldii]
MSEPDNATAVYLDGKGEQIGSQTFKDVVQVHANTNWKSWRRWYWGEHNKAERTSHSEQALQEMQRILVRQDGNHPVNRADLCDGTLSFLDAWAAVPLVPGTKEYMAAKRRMIRDILYEKLMGSAVFFERRGPQNGTPISPLTLLHRLVPQDPNLAALNLTKGEISDGYLWIYRTPGGGFAKHQAYRQPFSYPVLARDGVTTLPPCSSEDNDHLYANTPASSVAIPRTALSLLPVNKSTTSNERFHPYPRPRTTAKSSVPPTDRERPLALLDGDPTFPVPVKDRSFPIITKNQPSAEADPSNAMILDRLIQEAKDKSAVIGYNDALSRGLLRPKGSRVQWAPGQPRTVQSEQAARDEMLRSSRPATFEPKQTAGDEMLQVRGAMPVRPKQALEAVMLEAPWPVPIRSEQVAEDVMMQDPRFEAFNSVQRAEDVMQEIPYVQMSGGFASVASYDSEQFEHLRFLDRS